MASVFLRVDFVDKMEECSPLNTMFSVSCTSDDLQSTEFPATLNSSYIKR
jgi:hypothetical protein